MSPLIGNVRAKNQSRPERPLSTSQLDVSFGLAVSSWTVMWSGAQEKVRATAGFLKRKLEEYQGLEREIEELKREVRATGGEHDGLHRS